MILGGKLNGEISAIIPTTIVASASTVQSKSQIAKESSYFFTAWKAKTNSGIMVHNQMTKIPIRIGFMFNNCAISIPEFTAKWDPTNKIAILPIR